MEDLYFKISEDYEKLCNEIIAGLCKNCPHQHDDHSKNCAECCPMIRAIEAWQKGKTKKV